MKYSVRPEFIDRWTRKGVDSVILTDREIRNIAAGWGVAPYPLYDQLQVVVENEDDLHEATQKLAIYTELNAIVGETKRSADFVNQIKNAIRVYVEHPGRM